MKPRENASIPVPASGPGFDNMDWYLANLDRLIDEYQGQHLAIQNCQVVASSHSARELGERVREMGLTRVLPASSSHDAMQSYIG